MRLDLSSVNIITNFINTYKYNTSKSGYKHRSFFEFTYINSTRR